jgi:hypothetical protein
MSARTTVALLAGATAIVAGGVSIGAVQKPTLTSGKQAQQRVAPIPPLEQPDGTEPLFRGDMIPELGVGCSNTAGTTGGPNEWATRVTATLPAAPAWGVTSTTYNIFSFQSGPTWNLMAWQNTPTIPGAVIATCPLGPGSGTLGNHTIAVPTGCLTVPAPLGPTFFFGLSQGADTVGVRVGQDSNGPFTPNTVFIRAATCGLAAFASVESIGLPGNWVHRIIVDNSVPVELMDFDIS